MPRRLFNRKEKQALFMLSDGKCEICGEEVEKGWHADHVTPYSKGGKTDIINGQCLCARCNLEKGDRVLNLRDWQNEFYEEYIRKSQKDFLLTALPGGGKTYAALTIVNQKLKDGVIDKFIIVVPTCNLKTQWAIDAKESYGLDVDHKFTNEYGIGLHGIAVTYNQINFNWNIFDYFCKKYKIFVIFDEIHHCADCSTWGQSVQQAFNNASNRLCLTGTPFRGDKQSIPFVNYYDGICSQDFVYDYPRAIKDNVIRIVSFKFYNGEFTWLDHDGTENKATFKDKLNENKYRARLKTALDPDGKWMESVLKEANEKLDDIRNDEEYNAGGIIIARDQPHARSLAKLIQKITKETPSLIISEEDESDKEILAYKNSNKKWIVAVKKISEGVNIKRLRVLVWATNIETELFFRQVIGRIVRYEEKGDTIAYAYLPDVPTLKEHANKIIEFQLASIKEEQENEIKQSRIRDNAYNDKKDIIPLNSSMAILEHISIDGEEFPQSDINRVIEKAKRVGVSPEIFLRIEKSINQDEQQTFAQINNANNNVILKCDEIEDLRRICNKLAYRLSIIMNKEVKEIHWEWQQQGGKKQSAKDEEDLRNKIKWLQGQLS